MPLGQGLFPQEVSSFSSFFQLSTGTDISPHMVSLRPEEKLPGPGHHHEAEGYSSQQLSAQAKCGLVVPGVPNRLAAISSSLSHGHPCSLDILVQNLTVWAWWPMPVITPLGKLNKLTM